MAEFNYISESYEKSIVDQHIMLFPRLEKLDHFTKKKDLDIKINFDEKKNFSIKIFNEKKLSIQMTGIYENAKQDRYYMIIKQIEEGKEQYKFEFPSIYLLTRDLSSEFSYQNHCFMLVNTSILSGMGEEEWRMKIQKGVEGKLFKKREK